MSLLSAQKIADKMGITRTVVVDRMRRRGIEPTAIEGTKRLYHESVIKRLNPYFARPEARGRRKTPAAR